MMRRTLGRSQGRRTLLAKAGQLPPASALSAPTAHCHLTRSLPDACLRPARNFSLGPRAPAAAVSRLP
eukprot:6630016-Pyramimonas_sp.AAC.1